MNTAKRDLLSLIAHLILCAGVCGGLSQAGAQETCADSLTTVLLPTTAAGVDDTDNTFQESLPIAANDDAKPKAQSFLQFNVSAIPKGAPVCAWTLRLYQKNQQQLQERQIIRAFQVAPFDPKTLAWKNVTVHQPPCSERFS